MSNEAVHGLTCPRCGGIVPIPEGQPIVICPYCDQRSLVAATAAFVSAPALPAAAPAPAAAPTAPAAAAAAAVSPAAAEPKWAGSLAAAVSAISGGAVNPAADMTQNVQADDRAEMSIGVRRYQAPLKIERDQAVAAWKRFLSGKFQVARDAAGQSTLHEVFLVHLPFWGVWGRAAAYAFGQEKVGSGDHSHYEPREKKVVREMSWNCPACEVGEFGVRQISLDGEPERLGLVPFNADVLHRTGMVFEPVSAEQTALEAARAEFESTVRGELSMDRTAQVFTRLLRPRMGLVYYPLWVIRYLYRGRSFQVVVDGVDGQVLYGKAPGSVAYRAAVLVGGMAAGSVVAIDVPMLILNSSSSSSHDSNSNPFLFALLLFVAGLVIIYTSYRTFRYGEHYEYHRYGAAKGSVAGIPLNLPGNLRQVTDVVRTLEKFT